MNEGLIEAVEAFLGCSKRRDWATARALLADTVTRTGPDGSVLSGSDRYMGYLGDVLGAARRYEYTVRRCLHGLDVPTVLVELDELLVDKDGKEHTAREAMIFDFGPDGRIAALSVYAQFPAP